jgi:hypothetical protein
MKMAARSRSRSNAVRNAGEVDTGATTGRSSGSRDSIEIASEVDQELYFQNTGGSRLRPRERVDKSKLLLTITSLSVERGGDGLHAMSLAEALTLASTAGVKPRGYLAGAGVRL